MAIDNTKIAARYASRGPDAKLSEIFKDAFGSPTANQVFTATGPDGLPNWSSTIVASAIASSTLALSAPQTTVNGSSGSYNWSQPEIGSSYKKVVIYCAAYTNASTSAIVFATPFVNTPIIAANGTNLTISTISNTGVTLPASTAQTGFIILEGY
jgi:hypothetical protein